LVKTHSRLLIIFSIHCYQFTSFYSNEPSAKLCPLLGYLFVTGINWSAISMERVINAYEKLCSIKI